MLSKKNILLSLLVFSTLSVLSEETIDRFALVNRHNVILHEADPLSPLSVGNGDFAFTADITGMQSFENYYYTNGIPLETLCTWAWHSFPNVNGYKFEETMKESDFHGRKIKYASIEKSPAAEYYRMNPHPVPLGQIGLLDKNGNPIDLNKISDINQKLDLWKGIITSSFSYNGQKVYVETVADPFRSIVAFRIKSKLIKKGELVPAIRFPYSYDLKKKNKPPYVWDKPGSHSSTLKNINRNAAEITRIIDTTNYCVNISWKEKAALKNTAAHFFILESKGSDCLTFTVEFLNKTTPLQIDGNLKNSPETSENTDSFKEIKASSEKAWQEFWTKGGAADFSNCKDPRGKEIERRIILSQYLLKINYSGHFPPQETGLTHISWYGKHNSEVYWIHAAQFYMWNHTELLENGLSWYNKIIQKAKDEAKSKGFEGAMWPKMAGYDGRPTPGGINPFIIWNQPNPVYLCELVYRAHKDRSTLEKYKDIVFETAGFLASYAFFDANQNRYILGPPIKSVNESNDENHTQNPGFELVQWYYGLKVAQEWRERLGLQRDPHWDDVINKLSRLTVVDGKYVQLETEPEMYDKAGGLPSDIIMALGYMPETPMVDKEVMKNTFKKIYERNGLNSFVSWAMGKGALSAARMGFKDIAVDIVSNTTPKACFSLSGFVQRPKEGLGCPAYFPVNSSFLAATGLMLGGWDEAGEITPGFPKDGNWDIRTENMLKMP